VNCSRRDLAAIIPALAAATAFADGDRMVTSRIYQYADLPAKPNGQNTGRNVFDVPHIPGSISTCT
jgi:hypothetical protein